MAYYTSSVTWSVPSGIDNVRVVAVGGGGGGGVTGGGSGGGGGAYVEGVLSVAGLSQVNVFVGQGGASNGGNGGDTCFLTITASGGGHGGNSGGQGGAGGTANGGNININGTSVNNLLQSGAGAYAGNPFFIPISVIADTPNSDQIFGFGAAPGKGGNGQSVGSAQTGSAGIVILYY